MRSASDVYARVVQDVESHEPLVMDQFRHEPNTKG